MSASPTKLIWCLRHGNTVMDISSRSDGMIDLPLSEVGQQNVVRVLDEFLKPIPIACIYHSDLIRTKQTAHIIASGLPSNPDVEVATQARPWDLGSLSGSQKKSNRPIVQSLLENTDQSAPGGESYDAFTKRFDPWVKKMQKDSEQGQLLLILSGSNCRRISELLFKDREILNVDETGLFLMFPANDGTWSAMVIDGHKADDGDDS